MADTISQTLLNKFNEAIEELSAAQETVVNAVAQITDAQGDVTAAVNTANQAKQLAQTASQNASSAVNTANTASQNANSAVSTANTADQNATTAVMTANGAKNTADAAAAVVANYSSEIESANGGAMEAMSMAGLANREVDKTRNVRFQELTATILNRGVVSGVNLTKSATATRNVSVSNGVAFLNGRTYPVSNQVNTAHIANNTGSSAGTVYIYMYLDNGVMEIESTVLNGTVPENGIEIARCTVPAGNTENNDPYIGSVTITDTARREPGWPTVQLQAGQVYVPLNRTLPDGKYTVETDVESATSLHQLGQVAATNKLSNGFLLVTTGNADSIAVRMRVSHPEAI